ncbi:sugar phosphate nucleotidyltransferase [Scatolibacter rhodanostii]|uniref:sugar phosphate nucleotidyltransferase n=1 Tax=Scatolibacter rhodanostii TaxID=2014781 RepID=UPI000C084CD0
MKEPVLLIMAAGLGSRYGGLKQIDPVGQNGEIIIDYSLFDAARAGFKKAVFVIKEENLKDFQDVILPKAGKHMQIEFVFQTLEKVPAGFNVPEERVKPWGTGHAALMGKECIEGPFAVINADDFYGREAFEKIYQFLTQAEETEILPCAMVGFQLKNTVTENGSVSRGVCETEGGLLKNIVERTRIEQRENAIAYTEDEGKIWHDLPENAPVSMNMWGFTNQFFAELEKDFARFLLEEVKGNPLKAEFYLPFVVNALLQKGKAKVEVLTSQDKWYGVTYKEDKEMVMAALAKLAQEGIYPSPLWS